MKNYSRLRFNRFFLHLWFRFLLFFRRRISRNSSITAFYRLTPLLLPHLHNHRKFSLSLSPLYYHHIRPSRRFLGIETDEDRMVHRRSPPLTAATARPLGYISIKAHSVYFSFSSFSSSSSIAVSLPKNKTPNLDSAQSAFPLALSRLFYFPY